MVHSASVVLRQPFAALWLSGPSRALSSSVSQAELLVTPRRLPILIHVSMSMWHGTASSGVWVSRCSSRARRTTCARSCRVRHGEHGTAHGQRLFSSNHTVGIPLYPTIPRSTQSHIFTQLTHRSTSGRRHGSMHRRVGRSLVKVNGQQLL